MAFREKYVGLVQSCLKLCVRGEAFSCDDNKALYVKLQIRELMAAVKVPQDNFSCQDDKFRLSRIYGRANRMDADR
jgi:hypothetical protein